MNNEEKNTVIAKVRNLWSSYVWNDDHLGVWYDVLTEYDYQTAITAISTAYRSGEVRGQQQIIPVFVTKCKLLVDKASDGNKKYKDPPLDYELKCTENEKEPELGGVVKKFYRAASKYEPSPDTIMRWAGNMQEVYHQLYGGNWIILRQVPI